MIDDIIDVLHETTIAVSVATFYIDLLHLTPLFSPPRESNMFLNFCNFYIGFNPLGPPLLGDFKKK